MSGRCLARELRPGGPLDRRYTGVGCDGGGDATLRAWGRVGVFGGAWGDAAESQAWVRVQVFRGG